MFVSLKRDEIAFREVFGVEAVRKQFISDVTGIPLKTIRSVRIVSPVLRKRTRKQKQGILDLALTLNDDTRIDIEVQLRSQKFWIKRNLFYLSHLYADELWTGEDYDKLKKSITISILDFKLLQGKKYHSVYTLRDQDGEEFTDLLEVHIIELRKELTEESPVNGWIRLFNAETKEELSMVKKLNRNAGIAKAVEILEKLGIERSLSWYWVQSQKARRDRAAEDAYIRDEGQDLKLVTLVCRKLRKGKGIETIAEELEEDIAEIQLICEAAEDFSPEYDEKKVFAEVMERKRVFYKHH
ncbi:MAG: Rpn family recombination-promoting nuclease/putative transposase [Lachnospiraceae bacterium]|nr:Rpn family recombination-promoting nuclease/putative transposase [Lachnospiraceae bacterium]